MIFLKQTITNVLSSTLSEEYADYDSSITYSYENDEENLTDNSVVLFDKFYWRSFTNNNLGNTPKKGSENWFAWEVSNKQAMFDLRSTTKSSTSYDRTESGTTTTVNYKKKQRVYDSINDKVYTCIQTSAAGTLLTNTSYFTESSLDIVITFPRILTSETIAIGNFAADSIKIEYLDNLNQPISEHTQEFIYEVNDTVYDYYTYIYEPYSNTVDRFLKVDTKRFGTTIRVTFKRNTTLNYAECGFLVYGEAIKMGSTIDNPTWTPSSYSTRDFSLSGRLDIVKRAVQDTMSFQTIYDSKEFPHLKRKIKTNLDEICVFILDESDSQVYENIITLGIMEEPSVSVATSSTKSEINWKILEVI